MASIASARIVAAVEQITGVSTNLSVLRHNKPTKKRKGNVHKENDNSACIDGATGNNTARKRKSRMKPAH